MSNPFVLQQKLLKQILKEKPSVKNGMAAALKAVQAAKHGEAWKKCGPVDWVELEAKWVKWFEALLKKHPARKAELLWFEVLSDINPAMTSVSGYEKLNRADEDFGLEAGRFWPEDRKGDTVKEGLLGLPELDGFFAAAGWKHDAGEDDQKVMERLRPGYYALSYAAVALLVINGLPKTKLLKSVDADEIGVMAGWIDGDYEPIGLLSAVGWKPLTIDRKAKAAKPKPPDLDRIDQYLKEGGDPNWRDESTGHTLIMSYGLTEDRFYPMLIRAGADVTEVDDEGNTIFHRVGACKLPLFRTLIEKGADPSQRTDDGQTGFDRVCEDDWHTVEHLELMWKAGGRPTKEKGGTPRAFGWLAQMEPDEPSEKKRLREILRFWRGKKIDFDAPDQKGYPPLWNVLEWYADNRAEWAALSPKERVKNSYMERCNSDITAIQFIENGADPDARLRKSENKLIPRNATPLMVQWYENDRLVRALLKHGADPLAKSAEGKTALDYARAAAADSKRLDAEGAQKIVKILEKAVAAAEKKGGSKRK